MRNQKSEIRNQKSSGPALWFLVSGFWRDHMMTMMPEMMGHMMQHMHSGMMQGMSASMANCPMAGAMKQGDTTHRH